MTRTRPLAAAAVAVIASFTGTVIAQPTTAPTTGPTTKPQPVAIKLTMSPTAVNMEAMRKNNMGYMPALLSLTTTKPATVTKEPTYAGTPKYGLLRIGNGPKSDTLVAIDEAKEAPGKIYIDHNQNGDLTDDGDGAWTTAKENEGITSYQLDTTVHASYGTPLEETEGADYGLMIYKRHGDNRAFYAKFAARTGTMELGGKSYPVMLSENNGDGLYIVGAKQERSRRPLEFMIDVDGDGTFTGTKQTIDGKDMNVPERFRIADAFQFNGQWWLASPSLSGAELTLIPTSAPGATVANQAPTEERKLVAAGTVAPDFTAIRPDGKPIKLSDLRGKTVILDFWATWCGPCKVSMPGLQKTYTKIQSQDVEVLSVCVWDERELFDTWCKTGTGKNYTFTWAYDPAGTDSKTSIAAHLYGVSGIPTMFVIDKTGKIAGGLVGSGQEAAMVKLLQTQGINVPEEPTTAPAAAASAQ